MKTYVEFTIAEVFNALAQNGLEHLRGQWTAEDMDGIVIGGCALGQAAINLGVLPIEEGEDIEEEFSLFRQLDNLYTTEETEWGAEGESIGNVITGWNDSMEYTREGFVIGYKLKTYGEVVDMAYTILFPYFDKKIKLLKKEWRLPVEIPR